MANVLVTCPKSSKVFIFSSVSPYSAPTLDTLSYLTMERL
jgi:hypothetical protein